MFAFKRYIIAPHERGLMFRDRQLVAVLEPGVQRVFDPLRRVVVERYDIADAVFHAPHGEALMLAAPALLAPHLEMVTLADHEVGLVYRDGRFVEALGPSERRLYWKVPTELRVDRVDVGSDLSVAPALVDALMRTRGGAVARELAPFIFAANVEQHFVGMLVVDGELLGTLKPGFHAFWSVKRRVAVEQFDTRMQAMEVQGQEMLSRDKVSLRLNLGAQFRAADPIKARAQLQKPLDWLYRELQFALRQAVGTRDLDRLLEDKDGIDREVFAKLASAAADNGLELCSVGLKDVILPGEMKDILNQVVQAEKAAQANVIKRREETAATRSLLNTAKLMDQNPTLLRLKEMETLEKVTDKVGNLTVFGGLDGVLKDTVRIHV